MKKNVMGLDDGCCGEKNKIREKCGMRRSWSAGDIGTAEDAQFCDPYMQPIYYHDRHGANFSWAQGSHRYHYVTRLALISFSLMMFVFIFLGIFFITMKTLEYAANERSAHVMIRWYGCYDEYQSAKGANSTYNSKFKYMEEVFERMANDRQIKMEELMIKSMTNDDVKRYCANVTMETTTKAINAIRKRKSPGEKFVRK